MLVGKFDALCTRCKKIRKVSSFKELFLSGLCNSCFEEEMERRDDVKDFRNRGNTMNKIYTEFDKNIHVIKPFKVPKDWYDILSIDPGLYNPFSVHWYAKDLEGNIYVIAEHYQAGENIEYHSQKVRKICEQLKWPMKDGKIETLIDHRANQRTMVSSKSLVELLQDFNFKIDIVDNTDVLKGIEKVKKYLSSKDGHPKLFIFDTCVNMIEEFENYIWGSAGIPVKKDDHALDELRHYIVSKGE